MPAAVDKYLATNNLQDVMAEQQAIIRLYKQGYRNMTLTIKLYIQEIFDRILLSLMPRTSVSY